MIKKILTPTDGSDTAKAAVEFARDIAVAEDAEVVVLGVVLAVQYGDMTAYDAIPDLTPAVERVVAEEVAQLLAAGAKARGKTVEGNDVATTIVEQIAEERVDVVVMGTHGRTGLARAIIGSVADRVVRRSNVPVLLVPKR
jgi:nucleotide-binding universal stress UspA family protein